MLTCSFFSICVFFSHRIYCDSNFCFLSALVMVGVVEERSGVSFLLRYWGCKCWEIVELLLIVDTGVEVGICEDKPDINLSTRRVCWRFSAKGYSFLAFDCSSIWCELLHYFTDWFKFPRISWVRIKNYFFLRLL